MSTAETSRARTLFGGGGGGPFGRPCPSAFAGRSGASAFTLPVKWSSLALRGSWIDIEERPTPGQARSIPHIPHVFYRRLWGPTWIHKASGADRLPAGCRHEGGG